MSWEPDWAVVVKMGVRPNVERRYRETGSVSSDGEGRVRSARTRAQSKLCAALRSTQALECACEMNIFLSLHKLEWGPRQSGFVIFFQVCCIYTLFLVIH